MQEYLICLEHNQKNKFINKIIVFYDTSKGTNELLDNRFRICEKIQVIECSGRPRFVDLISFCNNHCENENIIVCNSDIIFDYTLNKFENISLKNKIYALTRWEYIDETTPKPRLQNGKIQHSSKDSWIFQAPLELDIKDNDENFENIQIGTWNCDGALNYFLSKQIVYECLNIKSYHIHFCNARTVTDGLIIY